MQISIFYITHSDKERAAALGRQAIEKKLAGCANILPMNSLYPWKGSLHEENEHILILKTLPDLKDALTEFVSAEHHYEVPCIMNWNVDVNESYGNWIRNNIEGTDPN